MPVFIHSWLTPFPSALPLLIMREERHGPLPQMAMTKVTDMNEGTNLKPCDCKALCELKVFFLWILSASDGRQNSHCIPA